MARRIKDDPHTRNTNEMTPEERRNLKPGHAKSASPSKVADLIQNQKVPSGEHPEGTAPPLERLTEKERRKTDWSDVT
jgi:hypothetical protein